MKLDQSTLQRTFAVNHNRKTYYVDYLNSDGQTLGLLNRDYWEVRDEDGEELDIFMFKDTKKKEKEQIKKNGRLWNKLVNFCMKHFDDYKPELV